MALCVGDRVRVNPNNSLSMQKAFSKKQIEGEIVQIMDNDNRIVVRYKDCEGGGSFRPKDVEKVESE